MLQTFFSSKNGIKILISSRDINVLNFKQISTYNWLFAQDKEEHYNFFSHLLKINVSAITNQTANYLSQNFKSL